MAFKEIVDKFDKIPGVTPRFLRLYAYERMLDGTFYDDLPFGFSQEDNNGSYIPLQNRRPSTPYNIPRIIVDQTAGLLFSEEQFPNVRCSFDTDEVDEPKQLQEYEKNIATIIRECNLETIMLDVFEAGNVGSCAILVRGLDDSLPYIEVIPGKNAKPVFDKRNPRKLLAIVQVYPADTQELIEDGYDNINPDLTYFMRIAVDDEAEIRYRPLPAHEYENIGGKRNDGTTIEWVETERYEHNFGRCPAVWVKNLSGGKGVDGPCTWGTIADDIIEIDYLLSQLGRGLRYSQDPMLAIEQGELASVSGNFKPLGDPDDDNEDGTNQRDANGKLVRSPNNILSVEGKAKLLEITGGGFDATGKHLERLREWALEVIGGMKSNAHDQGSHQSGRALEILHNNLLLLVKRQRVAYGNNALIPLLRIILTGIQTGEFEIPGVNVIDPNIPLHLIWNDWKKPSGSDLMNEVQALQIASGGSTTAPKQLLPDNIVTEQAAKLYGLPDPNRIVRDMESQRAEQPQPDLSETQEEQN